MARQTQVGKLVDQLEAKRTEVVERYNREHAAIEASREAELNGINASIEIALAQKPRLRKTKALVSA